VNARYMLDTDTCVYISKRRPMQVGLRMKALEPGSVVVSVVTYGELVYGAGKSENVEGSMAHLRVFLDGVPVEGLGPGVGRVYGDLRAKLESRGRPIGNNDLWIAAHAIDLGLTLVTNNEREFGRIPGLSVENWAR